MVARGWGVLPVHLAHIKEHGHAPIPAGDHEGRPYGSSGLLPIFMASVDASWSPVLGRPIQTSSIKIPRKMSAI